MYHCCFHCYRKHGKNNTALCNYQETKTENVLPNQFDQKFSPEVMELILAHIRQIFVLVICDVASIESS